MAASVVVTGHRVRLRLSNRTTGDAFTKTLFANAIDTSSAEWIIEAPSACQGTSADAGCQIMPLANFGATRISEAKVLTTAGRTGSINADRWDAVQIHMRSSGGGRFGRRSSGDAITGPLSASGRAFTVTYSAG